MNLTTLRATVKSEYNHLGKRVSVMRKNGKFIIRFYSSIRHIDLARNTLEAYTKRIGVNATIQRGAKVRNYVYRDHYVEAVFE